MEKVDRIIQKGSYESNLDHQISLNPSEWMLELEKSGLKSINGYIEITKDFRGFLRSLKKELLSFVRLG